MLRASTGEPGPIVNGREMPLFSSRWHKKDVKRVYGPAQSKWWNETKLGNAFCSTFFCTQHYNGTANYGDGDKVTMWRCYRCGHSDIEASERILANVREKNRQIFASPSEEKETRNCSIK